MNNYHRNYSSDLIRTSSLVLLLAFISCNKSSSSVDNSTGDIWPLKINNEWTFSFTSYNENGTIQDQSTETGKIDKDTVINGEKFFRFGLDYLRNSDNNTVTITDGIKFIPYLKRSNVDGDKYYSTTTTIYITNGSCTAPIDCFSYIGTTNINGHACLRDENIYKDCSGRVDTKIINYYEPGIGLISIEKYRAKSTGTDLYLMSKEILQSYKLN